MSGSLFIATLLYNYTTRPRKQTYLKLETFTEPSSEGYYPNLTKQKMSSETSKITSELTTAADYGLNNLNETELTLGLPGESRGRKLGTKRRFSDTFALKLSGDEDSEGDQSDPECSDATKPPPEKEQVVGWPPVRSYRKNVMNSTFNFVKVAVDGAPYLRKVDLESYAGYQQLLYALEDIFSCFTIEIVFNEKKLMDPVNRIEYIPTYEDKDGDWMLVGDVPWKMFIDTCKRIRLMRSSEAINGLAPRTPSKCSFSSC